MRPLKFSLPAVAPLGLGAALLAHETLRAIASLRLGAPSFAAHEHGALGPVAWVETVLALWIVLSALSDAFDARRSPRYRREPRARVGDHLRSSGGIAIVAIATLFGMEFVESGSAAFGYGWLGGALFPGAFVLTFAIAAAAWLLHFVSAGRVAGFERLVALFAAVISQLIGITGSGRLPRRPRASLRIAVATAPCARHAGLRAPPATFR